MILSKKRGAKLALDRFNQKTLGGVSWSILIYIVGVFINHYEHLIKNSDS